MELVFLGTGTSHGVPMLGCGCKVCRSMDPRDHRGRASALLKWDGHCVVVDTGAEFRQQALREGLMAVDAVLYTHAHADHIHGIDDLRAFSIRRPEPIPIHAADATCGFLERTFRYIFAAPPGTPHIPRLTLRRVGSAFDLLGRQVTPVPICHGDEMILGFRVGGLAYLTDCSGVPGASMALLQGLDALVIGALMPKPHEKHFSVGQALELVDKLRPRRALLTHISHHLSHQGLLESLPAGVEPAYDGLRVEV